MNRAFVLLTVSELVEGRPVRWLPEDRRVGDYDGCDRTLQVFCADPKDQRRLLDKIDEHRDVLEKAAGGPMVLVFHSVEQSTISLAQSADWVGR
jgi:hypothetical protein